MITIGATTGFSAVTKNVNYQALNGDLVLADASSQALTITLPATGPTNMQVTVKKTDTSTNIVTVVGSGASTIDGDSSCTIVTPGAAAVFAYDGTNWRILSTAVINSGSDSLQSLWVPTYASGYWYDRRTSTLPAAQLISTTPGTNTVQWAIANITYVPVYLHRAVTIDTLAYVTGGTTPTNGAQIKFALYGPAANGTPGALRYDWSATPSSPTATSTVYTVAAAGTIPRGWSYFAFMLNATSIGSLYCLPNQFAQSSVLGSSSLALSPQVSSGPGTFGYSEAVTTAFPATATPLAHVPVSPTSASEPNVWFRVVS